MVPRPPLRVVRTTGLPILRQLRLEEALLRADPDQANWCILNRGIAEPAVVMGISGKPEELLFTDQVKARKVPVIKRFSGGGTVVVDHNTLFVTLICNASDLPDVQLYPRPIMKWTEQLYRPMFPPSLGFSLVETDYALGQRKIGGNAQAITKGRWLHHTSFLWAFDPHLMASLLRMPSRTPDYRKHRTHSDFLATLEPHFTSQEGFFGAFSILSLTSFFHVQEVSLESATKALDIPHLSGTEVVNLP